MDTFQSGSTVIDETRGLIKTKPDGHLESPKHIIKSPAAARALYSIIRGQSLKRIQLLASMEGLVAGNPPYDQAELDTHGLSFLTNYNDLSAGSRVDKECLGYFNLLNQAEILVAIELDLDGAEKGDSQRWAQIMSVEFGKMLKRWKSFPTMMGTHTAQLAKFGLSVLLWPDERDWRPRTIELHRFLVPDQTLADLDQLTYCFFESDFTAQFLFEAYEEVSKGLSEKELLKPDNHKKFWSPYVLGEILRYRANSIIKPNAGAERFRNFFDLQVALQNGDYTFDQIYGDGIRLITLLYKEYDGTITHYMFDPIWPDNSAFLFLADRQYHDFSEACAIFTASPAHFTLHGNRGIAHKVFAPCQAKNQLACSMVDMARYSSTPMLRNNGGSVKDPEQIKMFPGVPTDIGAAEFVQNNLGNNIQQVVGALQFLEQNLDVNLGMGGDDAAVPDQSNASVSPTQARLQSYREFSILKDRVAHFYNQMDHVYRNMLSIVLRSKPGYPMYELAKRFKDACLRAEVPEEAFEIKSAEWGLPDHIDIKASRVAGDGSTVGLLLGLQELAPIVSELPPKGTQAYVTDSVLAALGPDAVARYTQGMEDPDEVSGGASLAGVENAIMQLGQSPIFSPTNENKAHLSVHLALNIDVMKRVQQQQIDPIEAQKVFDHSIPHMLEHWQRIASSPFGASFVKRYKQAIDQVVQYATLNKKNAIKMYEARIKEQQQQAEQQNAVLSEERLKALQAEGEEQRKNTESERKMARQDRESEHRADLKTKDIESKATTDRIKIQVDAGVKREENQNDAQLERDRSALEQLTQVNVPK